MKEEDQALFKHNDIKKARLANIGITTRVATIKANVQVTNEAQSEINKALLTMQKNHTKQNFNEVLKGEKWIKTGSINLKGKPNWSSASKELDKNIFRNLNNNEIELDLLQKEITKNNDIIERLLQEDEFISCGNCGEQIKNK